MAALAALSGCFGKSAGETRYYMLDYPPVVSEKMKAAAPYDYNVRLKEFTIAEAYRRSNLVYRLSQYELLFYNFEVWAVKPERLVSDVIYRHIKEANLFKEFSREVGNEEPDFELTGDITALEEFDDEDDWYAHATITFTLQKYRNKEIVWSRRFDYRRPVKQQEPVFVVRELSVILETMNGEVITSLDSLFSGFKALPKETKTVKPENSEQTALDSVILPPPPDFDLPAPENTGL
jgi:ABC-type uncharacterized transport system auxiliary subunit